MLHRTTIWTDLEGNPLQVAVACLDESWEVLAEAVEQVGPFHPLEEQTARARDVAHHVGGWRAHQTTFDLG